MAKTVSDLLTSIKIRGQIPDDGGTLSDTNILSMASDELENVIFPRLMAMNEWHYAFSYTQALSSARSYRINSRCSGNRIISVEYTSDSVTYRTIKSKHPLLQAQDLGENYAIYGNSIVVSDAVPTSGTLRIRAVLRPSRLVASGGQSITGTNSATDQVTVASSAAFLDGDLVDILYESSPYENFAITTIDTVNNGTTITMASDVDATWIVPGIRIIAAETSDRVMLPDELHDYLCQRTVIRIMEARGFTQDMKNHMQKLGDMEVAFDRLVAPRSKGEFKAIVPEDYYIGRM